ncbi:hypothetical protein [Allosphingosinicella indica]|uniref:DUF1440 domain-containing protein n=1 Tax=Allosphingosinicella indica TaxID=941907 RepID=A0A1X7G020_9SPHN|nr:hypothetical protein [Allosphingosinicella indica]SMF61714.1 hypothetical protein SAMN06295910_0706 [Allosphingosinicella indica]
MGEAKAIAAGTLVAGTLDLTAACLSSILAGGSAGKVLRFVASGPFGDAVRQGGAGAAIAGAAVHYTIMAVIVTIFVLAARRLPMLIEKPVLWGLSYGLGVYIVMELVVLPLRWPEMFPVLEPGHIQRAMAFMMLLVGLPIGLIAAHYLRPIRN